MYFLYALGRMLEPALGRISTCCSTWQPLLGGSLGVIVIGGAGITAGASGAVFGLLAAATIGPWSRGINPFTTGIGATLILNPFITFAIPGISIGGHVGGMTAGADLRPGDARAAVQELPEMGVIRMRPRSPLECSAWSPRS